MVGAFLDLVSVFVVIVLPVMFLSVPKLLILREVEIGEKVAEGYWPVPALLNADILLDDCCLPCSFV